MKIDPHALLEDVLLHPHKIGWLAGKNLLTELHSKWIWECWGEPVGQHTALQAHRNGYKTTAITEVGSVWWFLTHPDETLLLVRDTFTEADKTLKAIIQYLQVPEIKALYVLAQGIEPEMTTCKQGQVIFNFKKSITKEGSIDCYGGKKVPTGSHYDRIIFDDLITPDDRIHRNKREMSKFIIREVMTNIVKLGGTVINVGTPWHKDDAWKVIEEDFKIPIKKYDCYHTNIITPEKLKLFRAGTTPSLFAANYELNHLSDEGQLFQDPIYDAWDHTVPYQWVVAHIDAKFSGDHTNALTIMSRRKDGRIQAWGKVFSEHIDEILPRVKEILYKFRANQIHVETNPDKGYVAKMLANNDPTAFKIKAPRVCAYQEAMDKHTKIVTYLKHYWGELVWANDTDVNYMDQILEYREGQEPDDACFVAGTMIATNNGFVPIEDIKVGMLVTTPIGLCEVEVSKCTGRSPVIEAFGLTATADHKVFSKRAGDFIRLDSIENDDELSKLTSKEIECWKRTERYFLTETGTHLVDRESITFAFRATRSGRGANNSMLLFGKSTTEQLSQKDFTSTTLTEILSTTKSETFNVWMLHHILDCTQRLMKKIPHMLKSARLLLKNAGKLPEYGMDHLMALLGIKSTPSALLNMILEKFANVFIAKKSMLQNQKKQCTARIRVEEEVERVSAICFTTNVNIVEKNTRASLRNGQDFVARDADRCADTTRIENVYALKVSKAGCYYANGILVSNCDSASSLLRQAFFINDPKNRGWRDRWNK